MERNFDFRDYLVDEGNRDYVYEYFKHNRNEQYIVYGIGNMAVGVTDILNSLGLNITGYLVDDSYFDDAIFKSKTVRPLEDFMNDEGNKGKYVLVIGHAAGNRRIKELKKSCFFKGVLSIARPFIHHEGFDRLFVESNINEFEKVYSNLGDELSKRVFCAFVNSRISEDVRYVVDVSDRDMDEVDNDIYSPGNNEVYVDVGAYTGGSIRRFLHVCNLENIKKIIGIEPEQQNFERLQANTSDIPVEKKRLIQIGCYSKKARIGFNSSEDKCCRVDKNSDTYIDVDTLDNLLEGEFVTTLYIGISISILNILKGAQNVIRKNEPVIILSLGLFKEELLKIPQYILGLCPKYKIYLRFQSSLPSRMFMYAIPR